MSDPTALYCVVDIEVFLNKETCHLKKNIINANVHG